jgi:hypothetical protein
VTEREFCSLCGKPVEKKDRIKGVDNGHKECVKHFLKYLTRPRETEQNEPIRDPNGEIVSYQPLMPYQMKIFLDHREIRGITNFKFDTGIWEGRARPVVISFEMLIGAIQITRSEPGTRGFYGRADENYEINITTWSSEQQT